MTNDSAMANNVMIKTVDLTGAALDWAVAKCDLPPHMEVRVIAKVVHYRLPAKLLGVISKDWSPYEPSTHWAQGGPITERAGICVEPFKGRTDDWRAFEFKVGHVYAGPTLLIAAMRCYVASKLGEEVEIPEELL